MPRGAHGGEYRGSVGQTRTERLLYSCPDGTAVPIEVYRCVNARTHPDLARRLRTAGVNFARCGDRDPAPVHVPVVYHDPDARIFALVLPESARHRELIERADLLAELADDCEYEVPAYVRDFAVVFGSDGLADYLAERADRAEREAKAIELERELSARRARLEEDERAFRAERAELERVVADLERRNQELQARAERAAAKRDPSPPPTVAAARPPGPAAPAPPEARPPAVSAPSPRVDPSPLAPASPDPDGTPLPAPTPWHVEVETNPLELMSKRELAELEREGTDPGGGAVDSRRVVVVASDDDVDVATARQAAIPEVSADQIVEEEEDEVPPDHGPTDRVPTDLEATTVGGATDVVIERWIVSREPDLKYVDGSGVRLAASATAEELEVMMAAGARPWLQVHKLPTYPLIALSVAPEDKLDTAFAFVFDIADDGDRAVLSALGREFSFELHLFDREYLPVQRRRVTADLADNVRYALAVAENHLLSIPEIDRSFTRASLMWSDPDFDRTGRSRPERALFRRDQLAALDTPGQVRAALDLVVRFSAPELEELLVLVWGEPLAQWNALRTQVVLRAVDVGLWPGTALAQIAVSAGAARSRRELVGRLRAAFQRTVDAGAPGLSPEAIAENWRALDEVDPGRSAAAPAVVAGTIGADASAAPAARPGQPAPAAQQVIAPAAMSVPELIDALSDPRRRRDAAVELATRGDPAGIAPTFRALEDMTRAEAVAVLGNVVRYGAAAEDALIAGLLSGKAFIRHGCALALGVLKTEAGIEAVCDLLLAEPTEIWREIARAVGEFGGSAVMSLVSRLRDQDDRGRERLAWALAHVAARGGRDPVETLSRGRDPVAAGVARHALELAPLAGSDDRTVRGPEAPRDQTVNRAFSRKFFEAMNRDGVPDDDDALLLDEADLIEADAEVLDERDLIPT